jgi:hypothetical protein
LIGLDCRLVLFGEVTVFLVAEAGIGEAANEVQDADVVFGLVDEHLFEDPIAVVHQSLHYLGGTDYVSRLGDRCGVGGAASFAQELDRMFRMRFGAVDQLLIFDPLLVAALLPVGEVLEVQAFAGFAEFVDDGRSGSLRRRRFSMR